MKERPILFNTAMVQAILAGRKTQTRRALSKNQVWAMEYMGGSDDEGKEFDFAGIHYGKPIGDNGKEGNAQWLAYCTEYPEEGCIPIGNGLGAIGDRLWVRETFRPWHENDLYCGCYDICNCPSEPVTPACYLADGHIIEQEDREEHGIKWKPSIHMPRRACRIILEITSVRVERLQDIAEADAVAEGFDMPAAEGMDWKFKAKHNFKFQWDLIYKNWNENPWVWVIEFKVLTTNGKVPEVAA
jgi:hypothetical protein